MTTYATKTKNFSLSTVEREISLMTVKEKTADDLAATQKCEDFYNETKERYSDKPPTLVVKVEMLRQILQELDLIQDNFSTVKIWTDGNKPFLVQANDLEDENVLAELVAMPAHRTSNR